MRLRTCYQAPSPVAALSSCDLALQTLILPVKPLSWEHSLYIFSLGWWRNHEVLLRTLKASSSLCLAGYKEHLKSEIFLPEVTSDSLLSISGTWTPLPVVLTHFSVSGPQGAQAGI